MECKFLDHGLSISYDGTIKPCCVFEPSKEWKHQHNFAKQNLITWHNNTDLQQLKTQLKNNVWPSGCGYCERVESQKRFDSMRANGHKAYEHYQTGDITLEIRPGSTCNFACQTCWPEASSRVAQYQHQAGIIDINQIDLCRIDDFSFLMPVAHRIRDVILLGGEPFYDKSCRRFIEWSVHNLQAKFTMFTNGSMIDYEWLQNYPHNVTLVFSFDATGKPAEYIRIGTIWEEVKRNYQKCKQLGNVEVRVNITTSAYNWLYLESLIDWLCEDWPAVVSFGHAKADRFTEAVMPLSARNEIIDSLERAVCRITASDIEPDQKSNAINAVKIIIGNLTTKPYDPVARQSLLQYISVMDRLKGVTIEDHCPELCRMLIQEGH